MDWLRIVMSMRWDYYNLASSHGAFFEQVEKGKHRIAPMERNQILSCVIGVERRREKLAEPLFMRLVRLGDTRSPICSSWVQRIGSAQGKT